MKRNYYIIMSALTLLLFPRVIFGQTAPDLRRTSGFALFTAAGAFTNTGTSVVTGDIGSNSAKPTGFPSPGTVVGNIYQTGDAAATNAAADVGLVYSDLNQGGNAIAVSLGGQVLTRGVWYTGPGAAATLSGDLILDGQGNPNAIFIIRIDGALSVGAPLAANVILTGSALLCNVYWQINGQFGLADGSVFRGTAIVNGAINLLGSSSLFGRGLSTAGAISLQNNTVTIPICWTGATDDKWSVKTNWSNGSVPTTNDDVTIPNVANDPVIYSSMAADCKDLIVASDATLTIQSDDKANGSLIVAGTLTGIVTYNRYVTGSDKWHLISSPVGGQSISTFVTTGANAIATADPKYGLAPYNNTAINSGPKWFHFTTAGGANNVAFANDFIPGKGYEALRTSNGTFAFTGTIATSTVNIAITSPVDGNPWNLVGNPFPSAIHANTSTNFITENTSALGAGAYQAIYVWDANAGIPAYLTINLSLGATYIAPGQAFFVNSASVSTSVNFTEAMQTHQTGDIFKSGKTSVPEIKLIAGCSSGSSSTHIKFIENMTTGLDPGYDAGRFSGDNNSFAVYTHLAGDPSNVVDFDIQCLPAEDFDQIIPVGLNAPENTLVVFRTEITNLPAGVPVYLEDQLTGAFTSLDEEGSSYTVQITGRSEGTGRFFLHTKAGSDRIDQNELAAPFQFIPIPQERCLRIIGSVDKETYCSVYEIAGRQLLRIRLELGNINSLDLIEIKSGLYLVVTSSADQRSSTKIAWIY